MRLRDQRGQTGSDYLGVLLVIGFIVAALVSVGVPSKVAAETSRIVCEIGGGECPDAPPPTQTPAPGEDGPTQGPPIPAGPLTVLPFPGSVSVTCTVAENSPSACKPPKGPGVAIQASGTVAVERTPTKLDAKGCPVQVLSVATTLKLEGTGSAKGKTTSGKLSVFTAGQSKYSVTTRPEQADDIANRKRDAPNPLDPRTIRPGESVQMSEEFYAGHNLSAEYRALQASLGYEKGRRVSSGVTRVDASTARIYVGDENFVRSALAFGVGGKGAKISIGNTKELSDGKLRAIDIDISRPDGWAAYQAFIASGRLPETGMPGTRNPTSSKTIKYTDATKLEAELGNLKVGGTLGDSEGNVTETTLPDGSIDRTVHVRYREVGLEINERLDSSGNRIGYPSYALNAEGAHSNPYAMFQKANGGDMKLPPDGNVRMEFNNAQLLDIKDQALRQIQHELERDYRMRPPPSTAEIAAKLREHPGELGYGRATIVPRNPHATMIAGAHTPEDVLIALYTMGWRSSDNLFENLATFVFGNEQATGEYPNGGPRSRIPGTFGAPSCKS